MRLGFRVFGVVLIGIGGLLWTRPTLTRSGHTVTRCGVPIVRLVTGIGAHDGSDCHSFAAALVIFGACFAAVGLLVLALASDRALMLWHKAVEQGRRGVSP
jgi:hypothetical protein